MSDRRAVIIGLGGIGSHLAEPLARYIRSDGTDEYKDIVFVDGDTFSISNLDRQRAESNDIGGNKAESVCRRVRESVDGVNVYAVGSYIGPSNVNEIVREGDVVFLCVDNHSTRKLVSDRFRKIDEGILISAGNEYSDGNVQLYLRKSGRDVRPTAPLDKFHREIQFPQDRNPAQLSCQEIAELPGGGQIIPTNLTAAALSLNAFMVSRNYEPAYGEVSFDVESNMSRSFKP